MTPAAGFGVGTEIPALTVGPLTSLDLIRWAGYQENWLRVHLDREHAVQALGARDAVQSGHHRTALIVRAITDWLGEDGWVRRLSVRHAASLFPGDRVRCGGRVRAVHGTAGGSQTVELDVWAIAEPDKTASEGTAVVELRPGHAAARVSEGTPKQDGGARP